MKKMESVIKIQNKNIQDVGPNAKNRAWTFKPRPPEPTGGITYNHTTLIDDDGDTIDYNERELILVEVTDEGMCNHCGEIGPMYQLCNKNRKEVSV
jgi:hypothetical protein